ncbi:MAG: transporter substrate-binding domain-containing protein, partial [Desulfuromonadales bacterium]|nr:transporter substrate-binding domain-containing protein [Desulfuromonadales bacterium]
VGGPLEEFRQEFCFAVQEGNDELRRLLDEGLGLVFTKRIYERLYQEWILPLQKQRHGRSRIVVGGDHSYPPYEFLDENGQPAGYNVELTRAVARQLGVDVDFQLRPWYATR